MSTDNKAADIINDIIRAFASGGEAAAEAYITTLAPAVFGFPIMQFLLDQFVGYLGQFLSIASQNFADSIVIDIETHGEESSVINTAVALQYALGSGDKDAISLATKNLSTAYSNLFNFNGSSSAS